MHPDRHKFPANWPAPNEYLIEFGRMTVLWGSLESLSVVAFGKLVGYSEVLDIRAVIITAHLSFQQRVDVISTLCERLAPSYPHLKDYEAVIRQLKAAQRSRNKYTHNAATLDEETGKVGLSYATARGSLKLQTETVHLADVKEACAKIHEAACSLHSLVSGTRRAPIWGRV